MRSDHKGFPSELKKKYKKGMPDTVLYNKETLL